MSNASAAREALIVPCWSLRLRRGGRNGRRLVLFDGLGALLLQRFVGGRRQVREGDARYEENGRGCPCRLRQEVAGATPAEHLLRAGAAEDPHAAALSGLDEDDEDEEHARDDVHDGEGRVEDL